MQLKEFVTESLTQIMGGIKEAQNKCSKIGGLICPEGVVVNNKKAERFYYNKPVDMIEFDIAVIATEEMDKGGGGGINVYSVKLGGSVEKKNTDTRESRISFSIPVVFPIMLKTKPDVDGSVIAAAVSVD